MRDQEEAERRQHRRSSQRGDGCGSAMADFPDQDQSGQRQRCRLVAHQRGEHQQSRKPSRHPALLDEERQAEHGGRRGQDVKAVLHAGEGQGQDAAAPGDEERQQGAQPGRLPARALMQDVEEEGHRRQSCRKVDQQWH
jgi:hypothetical protein